MYDATRSTGATGSRGPIHSAYARRWMGLGLLGLGLITQTGCLTMLLGQKRSSKLDTSYLQAAGYSIPPGGMPSPVGQLASDGKSLVLEVRQEGEKPHLERIPLPTDRPMFVETLVQEAKIHERMGGVNITIMRPTGPSTPPVRMDVQVRDTGKVKEMEENYAIIPGDHLIVTYDQRTTLETFVDNIRGK